MKCQYCNGKLIVTDLVHNVKENETYRAKKCSNCGAIIYTVEYEVIQNQRFAEDWAANHRLHKKGKMK